MGDCFSSFTRWEEILHTLTMLHLVLLLSASSLATASGGVGHHGQYSFGQGVCTTVYDSATDTACHTEHDQACHTEHDQVCNTITEQACHTEFDTIVDTTHIEECQDIVTEQCHQVSQQVHHSSGVVGHNTQVVPGGVVAGYGHVKREAAGGTEVSRATLLGPSAMLPLRGSATRGLSRMPGRSLGRSVSLFPGRSATLSPGRSVSPSPARSVFLSQSRFLARSVTPPQLVSAKGASLAGTMDTFIRLLSWLLSVLWLLWLLLVLLVLLE